MKRGALWPVAITGVLLATVAVNIAVMVVANDDPSFSIEPDYYQKAVHWDAQMAQERTNAALGWRIAPSVSRAGREAATLSVRLTDASGAPLRGATVTVAALSVARASDVQRATLAPDADGAYAARIAVRRGGQWELRFTAARGAERFTAVERVEMPAGGP